LFLAVCVIVPDATAAVVAVTIPGVEDHPSPCLSTEKQAGQVEKAALVMSDKAILKIEFELPFPILRCRPVRVSSIGLATAFETVLRRKSLLAQFHFHQGVIP